MYKGISYPFGELLCRNWILKLWKKYCCPKEYHLLDEVYSDNQHYLYCDACELRINIDLIIC